MPFYAALINSRTKRLLVLFVAVVLVFLCYLLIRFVPEYPVRYASIEDHFKYGSIGTEPVNGLPYWIWKVLPVLFADKLPENGYRGLGFLYENGIDLPIGVSRRTVTGLDRVWLNCGVCHTGTYRETPSSARVVVLGMPANHLKLYDLIQFLISTARDNRFTPERMMPKIEEISGGDVGWLERMLYRYLVIPRVRTALLDLGEVLAFMNRQSNWGTGRVDTFNAYKTNQLGFPPDRVPQEELTGAADLPSIWGQKPREGMRLHWDGNNDSVQERNLSAALGAGVTPVTVDMGGIRRIMDWIWDLQPPPYPKKTAINSNKASTGKGLYQRYCSDCHGMKEGDHYDFDTKRFTRLGKVEAIGDIKTDPGRLDSYSELLAMNQNTLYSGYPWRFKRFRKTNGYASMPLDGIWLRSPYLHNGSVPTLRDLLDPSGNRPQRFYRGYDVLDMDKVGFISDLPEENGEHFFLFDTQVAGNSNRGHEGPDYGTHLSADEKDAIVEYMKEF